MNRFTPLSFFPQVQHLHRVIDPSKRVPIHYFLLASELASTRQPLRILSQIMAPPPREMYDLPPHMRCIFDPDMREFGRTWKMASPVAIKCAVCRRPGYALDGERHYFCSSMCTLACHLFLNDLLAIAGARRFTKTYIPGMKQMFPWVSMLRFVGPNVLPPALRELRLVHFYDTIPWTLQGNFADDYGMNFGSSLLINPIAVRRALRRHLKVTPMTTEPAVPTVPATTTALEPAPASPIEIASLANPVTRRMAEIVLAHLESANDFLTTDYTAKSGSKPMHRKGRHWSKDQVTLFLGLLNRTIPSVSASINLSATAEPKDPADMSREELEEAARKARLIGPTAGPTNRKDPGRHNITDDPDDSHQQEQQEIS